MRWRAVAVPLLVLACGDARPGVIGDPTSDAAAPDVAPATQVLWIDLSPLTLTPKFSPSTFDYTVRCSAGPTAATLTVTDTTGMTKTPVTLAEDQLLTVAGQYFIRCLPHDF